MPSFGTYRRMTDVVRHEAGNVAAAARFLQPWLFVDEDVRWIAAGRFTEQPNGQWADGVLLLTTERWLVSWKGNGEAVHQAVPASTSLSLRRYVGAVPQVTCSLEPLTAAGIVGVEAFAVLMRLATEDHGLVLPTPSTSVDESGACPDCGKRVTPGRLADHRKVAHSS